MATTDLRTNLQGVIHHPIGALEDAQIHFSKGRTSDPLLRGHLPLKRVIPTDFHSALDYSAGLILLSSIFLSRDKSLRTAAGLLGGSVIALSLLTDYRLSLAKVVPIEVHEVMDYVWGASVCAAPFIAGYAKRSPLLAAIHVITGAATMLGSLFTDYRGYRGVTWFGRHRAQV